MGEGGEGGREERGGGMRGWEAAGLGLPVRRGLPYCPARTCYPQCSGSALLCTGCKSRAGHHSALVHAVPPALLPSPAVPAMMTRTAAGSTLGGRRGRYWVPCLGSTSPFSTTSRTTSGMRRIPRCESQAYWGNLEDTREPTADGWHPAASRCRCCHHVAVLFPPVASLHTH
jgi:hypothetical protein